MGWTEGVAVVRQAVAEGVVPGAVLLAGTGPDDGGQTWTGGVLGQAADGGGDAAVDADTVYDLASLTKVLATLPAVLRLVDGGDIGLDDAVGKFLPGFAGDGKGAVTVRHLLAHTSGLPAHRELYRLPGTPRELVAAALAEPLTAAPGTVVCYSDLGFIALGEIVAAVAGQPLDRAAAELVFEPLGLPGLRYLPPPEWTARTAATEVPPGAAGPKVGVVHDENAEALGGVAGHAGLFGTGRDVAQAVRMLWLADESLLSASVRAEAFRCQTAGLDGRRGLGWTLRGDRWDHMSVAWPQSGAGHTGFTGTSVALDPVGGRWAVLLTNAVRFGREKGGVVALRRRLHDALAGAGGQVGLGVPGVQPAPGTMPAAATSTIAVVANDAAALGHNGDTVGLTGVGGSVGDGGLTRVRQPVGDDKPADDGGPSALVGQVGAAGPGRAAGPAEAGVLVERAGAAGPGGAAEPADVGASGAHPAAGPPVASDRAAHPHP